MNTNVLNQFAYKHLRYYKLANPAVVFMKYDVSFRFLLTSAPILLSSSIFITYKFFGKRINTQVVLKKLLISL